MKQSEQTPTSEIEIWKVIPGLGGRYSASSFGRIMNNKTLRVRKTKMNRNGYIDITLQENKKPRTFQVHRLVMLAFHNITNPQDFEVDHQDTIPTNNRLDNLQWLPSDQNKQRKRLYKLFMRLHLKHGDQLEQRMQSLI